MKITEEQYQELIKATRPVANGLNMEILGENPDKSIYESVRYIEVSHKILFSEFKNEIVALVNPLTREWAHEKFVEKEKKYYWTSKKTDNAGFAKRLYKDEDGMIVDHGIKKCDSDSDVNCSEKLTKTEIKSWGYDPDMFARKEV
ncbi:hypothetical protein ACT5YT_05615 [Leuconostoc suionicum]|uniref:hypothetical protein n=1 Tax=Leuconostoc suionicum TaxID=1511761 RepID=UPI0040366191